MTRKEANIQILSELSKLVEKYPDMRFIQLLEAVDISDPMKRHGKDIYYEESSYTLEYIKERIKIYDVKHI